MRRAIQICWLSGLRRLLYLILWTLICAMSPMHMLLCTTGVSFPSWFDPYFAGMLGGSIVLPQQISNRHLLFSLIGFEGPVGEWGEEFPRYVGPDGGEMTPVSCHLNCCMLKILSVMSGVRHHG